MKILVIDKHSCLLLFASFLRSKQEKRLSLLDVKEKQESKRAREKIEFFLSIIFHCYFNNKYRTSCSLTFTICLKTEIDCVFFNTKLTGSFSPQIVKFTKIVNCHIFLGFFICLPSKPHFRLNLQVSM